MSRRMRLVLLAAGLVLLTASAFSSVGSHPFVAYDDGVYVAVNPHVVHGLTADGVRWALTATENSNWHPVTWLSHMLDVTLFGLDPGPHHVVSLLLHMANTVVLFLLLVRMTRAIFRSALAAALFAVHPLHVESVAWIAERKDVLSTLLWLATTWAWLRWLEEKTARRITLVIAAFALGLMAKPMLVTLPLTLMLLDVWPLERATRPVLFREKLPLFAMAAVSCVITIVAQRVGGALQGLDTTPLGARVANALTAIAAYLGKTVYPVGLAVFYPYGRTGWSWGTVLSVALVAAISAAAWRVRRTLPYIAFGWGWLVVTLLPVIGLVQVGTQSMADRYTYVPLIGPFVAIAWAAGAVASRSSAARAATLAGSAAVLIVLVALTRIQAGTWASGEVLFEHALSVTKDNWMAHNNLGGLYTEQGRIDDAVTQFRETLRIRPEFAEGHYNLAAALARGGRQDDAIAEYEAALHLRPDYAAARYNLGNALLHAGRLDEAIAAYAQVLRLRPDDASAHNNLAIALDRAGRHDEALAHYREALRLRPDFEAARANLERAKSQGGVRP